MGKGCYLLVKPPCRGWAMGVAGVVVSASWSETNAISLAPTSSFYTVATRLLLHMQCCIQLGRIAKATLGGLYCAAQTSPCCMIRQRRNAGAVGSQGHGDMVCVIIIALCIIGLAHATHFFDCMACPGLTCTFGPQDKIASGRGLEQPLVRFGRGCGVNGAKL